MLLLRYDGSGWEEVAGSEASTDGALVCADGMSSFSPFAVGHKDSRPAFADDAAIGALVFPVDAVIEPVELPAVREGTGDGEIGYALTPALPAGLTREGRRLSGTPAEAFAQRRYTWTATDLDGDSRWTSKPGAASMGRSGPGMGRPSPWARGGKALTPPEAVATA